MKFTDEVFHNTINKKNLQREAIEELVAKYRPKVIKRYEENGALVTVFEAAFAEGANQC